MKGRAVFGSAEIALRQTPVANGFGNACHQRAHAAFALRRSQRAMQIFAGDDVGRRHGPVFRNLHVFLLEDHAAFGVGDLSNALLPFDFIVGGDAGLGEQATESQTGGSPGSRCGCTCRNRARSGLLGGDSCCLNLSHVRPLFSYRCCDCMYSSACALRARDLVT